MAEKETRQGNGVLKALLWTGVAVGAVAVLNATIFYKTPPLWNRMPGGTAQWLPLPEGDIYYERAGVGRPLLLLHGIGAGCSSFEWQRLFGVLSETRQVFAPDLLGFGKSDKPQIPYSAETYIDLIAAFIERAIGEKTDIVASSLSGAFALALAERHPELVGRLLLIAPTGLEALAAPLKPEGKALKALFSLPVVGLSLYNLITSRVGLREYLKGRIYANPGRVDTDLVDHFHCAAHQPGSERVLPYFVGGYLNCEIAEALLALPAPPTLVWGADAVETPLRHAEAFQKLRPNTQLIVLENAGSLPHDEHPEAFLEAIQPWLSAS